MQAVYKIIACQFDSLIPFTTRAKILVQDLWKKNIGWDDVIHPPELQEQWHSWENKLQDIQQVEFPRCYVPGELNPANTTFDLHIFCDSSEHAYGSLAYLRMEDKNNKVSISFVLAHSRVAPKKRPSMPRLELAQLASTLKAELTLSIQKVTLWSDSTTVLHWIRSESCRY